jgi:heme/copper-type cytochrome/quinol oxidase subunit 2
MMEILVIAYIVEFILILWLVCYGKRREKDERA